MKLIDRDGNEVAEDTPYLADRDNGDGTMTVFFPNDADIDSILKELSDKDIEGEIRSKAFWLELKDTCLRTGGKHCSKGSCVSGRCESQRGGGFNYCRCSSRQDP